MSQGAPVSPTLQNIIILFSHSVFFGDCIYIPYPAHLIMRHLK